MTDDIDIDRRIGELEARVIEQDHRPFSVFYSFFYVRPRLPKDDVRRSAATKALIWLFLSPKNVVTAGISIIAILGILLAYQANTLLSAQNARFDTQNQLAEASRRSALIFELTSINERIDKIRDDRPIKNDDNVALPPSLIGRIVALSRSFRPYFFVATPGDNVRAFRPPFFADSEIVTPEEPHESAPWLTTLLQDSIDHGESDVELVSRPLSPERGQLLVTLANANISNFGNFAERQADFRYSDLRGITITNFDLSDLDLQFSDFSGANLFDSVFFGADLSYAVFDGASMLGVQFDDETRLDSVSFFEARLNKAFIEVGHSKFSLRRSVLFDTKIEAVEYDGIDFEGAVLCQLKQGRVAGDLAELTPQECPGLSVNLEHLLNVSDRGKRRWKLQLEKVMNHPHVEPTSDHLVVQPAIHNIAQIQ